MPPLIVAWDIETCPFEISSFSPTEKRRYETELRVRQDRRPDEPSDEASRLVRSVHPSLGWICCIGAVSGTIAGGPNTPKTWTAASPEEEKALLSEFWTAVEGFPRSVTWATFNGKRFDASFLSARSLRHGLSPTRHDLLNTYPYNDRPHADLSRLWPQRYRLEDLCKLLGVSSPKDAMDGGSVARAVQEGRLDDVRKYGKRDVLATFQCASAAKSLLWES